MSSYRRDCPCGWFLALLAVLLLGSSANAAPEKLPATARIDVVTPPDSRVTALDDAAVLRGGGQWQRMNWLPADHQGRSLTIDFPITHFAATDFAGTFVPKGTGTIQLKLMGPWQQAPGGELYRQRVAWEALRVSGAKLAAGEFKPGQSWHNQPLTLSLAVSDGTPVTIAARARAVPPADFQDMQRQGNDTPAHAALKQFRRGANLGNYLEAPRGQDWGASYDERDFAAAAAEGFDHVRIPVAWQHYCGPGPQFKLEADILRKVDALVDLAQKHKLAAIINVHHFDDFTSDPAGQKARLVALWRQIAEHCRNRPATLAFELLNEPKDKATTAVLNPIYAELIRTIRKSNPERAIFVGPGQFNQVSQLGQLKLPDDDANLIVTIHSYDPFLFTHQGASWSGRITRVTGIQFPGPPKKPLAVDPALNVPDWVPGWIERYNKTPTEQNPSGPASFVPSLRIARQWSDYYGRPLHLGEFGAYIKSDPASRARFYRAYRQACDELDIAWCIWDWRAGFRYWNPDKHEPEPGMREALFGKP